MPFNIIFFLFGCNTTKDVVAVDTDKDIDVQPEDAPAPTDEPANEPTDDPSSEPSNEPGSEDTGEEPPPPMPIVRFIALGDGGEGNTTQYAVADVIEQVCDSKTDSSGAGCSFALYLGDNFYDEGVSSVNDPQFMTKFEDPYANLDFPFYISLGNHDYGGCAFGSCGAGWEFDKSDAQVEYTSYSDKWMLPSEYYHFSFEHADFFALDTNALLWDPWFSTGEDQYPWFDSVNSAATGDWKIAFGHHPFRSNGQHGNAGSYEGLDWLSSLGFATDVPLGAGVQDFVESKLCNNVDIYFSGHDHNRQWLESNCGVELIVSGAAAKTTDLQGRGNPTYFEDDSLAGFIWIELEGNCVLGEFYNETGSMDFTHQYCK